MWLSNPRSSHTKSNIVIIAREDIFVARKDDSLINGGRIDENLNTLIVILSVSNAQETKMSFRI